MEIGGYFGLELSGGNRTFHNTPYQLKSGRAALSLLINHLKPNKIYVPFYTCDALLAPLKSLGINYQFYRIDSAFELENMPNLRDGEYIIYVNYYDIMRDYVERLSNFYLDKLIVDCTQSYFTKGNGQSWFFNSSRKFFGVPDGSDLYVPDGYNLDTDYETLNPNVNFLTGHLVSRFNGDTQAGYQCFCENEKINGDGVDKMSVMSARLLSSVNFKKACENRQRNFRFLHQQLGQQNNVVIKDPFSPAPSFYPYLPDRHIDKNNFWQNDVFIPNFWTDCVNREAAEKYPTEVLLSKNLIPIPVDHRYTPADLNQVLTLLLTE